MKLRRRQQELYKERGVNQLAGCLPLLLQLLLLIPMYSVSSQGLTNYDLRARCSRSSASSSFDLNCDPAPIINAAGHVTNPCLDPIAFGDQLGRAGGHPRHGRRRSRSGLAILA